MASISSGNIFPLPPNDNCGQIYPYTSTTWTQIKEVPVKIEIYKENLDTLSEVLSRVEDIVGVSGVFDAEIRVKVDDMETWVVMGYGESGDPCILRFEKD